MTSADVAPPRLPWDAADPYPFYEARRRDGNVVWDGTANAWLVLGYHAARDVLAGQNWSSDPRANPTAIDPVGLLNSAFIDANMLFTDGRAHDRLRSAVRDMFGRNYINGFSAGIESICDAVVSAIPVGEPFDVMSQIALPLPIAVIGAWLDLDADQCAALREHSPAIVRILGGFADENQLEEGLAAGAALVADFLPAAADRRRHPGDDLLSFLAADPDLTLDEVVVSTILIAVAGHETTSNLLGASLVRLFDDTHNGTRPADHADPCDPAVLTELLRLDAPVQATGRTATADQSVAGIDIPCGETALVCVAAANRDPEVYDFANEFRPGRPGPAPLTFGNGAHYCLGAALARLETTTALQQILQRRPVLVGSPTWRDTPAIRGPLSVPARFTS